MRVLVLGGDGYLGWPTAMHFAARGHQVMVVDNYLRRNLARETQSEPLLIAPNLHERARVFQEHWAASIAVVIGNLSDPSTCREIFSDFNPDAVVHYAEIPSAPYSMMGFDSARLTLNNNLNVTFNVVWSVLRHCPDCHIIKLGTMGEYGTPNIQIEEGWLDVEHKGRRHTFLYPRQGGSLYHTTKVLDTDLLWFYVRTHGIRVTDLMQGPVYGVLTAESEADERLLPHFHYDDIFGTVLNRFLVQAAACVPLTVYGSGGQTRGYLNIIDTLRCVELAALHPAEPGQLRIFNQFTEVFSVRELADMVKEAGRDVGVPVTVESIPNPRKELEEHYYSVEHQALLDLGLAPHLLTQDALAAMLTHVLRHKGKIARERIHPRVAWH